MAAAADVVASPAIADDHVQNPAIKAETAEDLTIRMGWCAGRCAFMNGRTFDESDQQDRHCQTGVNFVYGRPGAWRRTLSSIMLLCAPLATAADAWIPMSDSLLEWATNRRQPGAR